MIKTVAQWSPAPAARYIYCYFLVFLMVMSLAAFSSTAYAQSPPQSSDINPPSYAAMADLLENTQSRTALIEQLRVLADTLPLQASVAPSPGAAVAGLPGERSLQVAKADSLGSSTGAFPTVGMAARMQDLMAGLSRDFSESAALIRSVFSGAGVRGITTEQWFSVFLSFAFMVAATVLAFWVFRAVAAKFFDRANAWVAHTPATPAGARPTSGLLPGVPPG